MLCLLLYVILEYIYLRYSHWLFFMILLRTLASLPPEHYAVLCMFYLYPFSILTAYSIYALLPSRRLRVALHWGESRSLRAWDPLNSSLVGPQNTSGCLGLENNLASDGMGTPEQVPICDLETTREDSPHWLLYGKPVAPIKISVGSCECMFCVHQDIGPIANSAVRRLHFRNTYFSSHKITPSPVRQSCGDGALTEVL